MVNYRFNKKGQAAIEFLMTYGWMLLVVLIVGALVFSFVDFNSLLPDSVDISTQSILGDGANSAAYATDYIDTALQSVVYVGFTYSGGQKATISVEDAKFVTDLDKECYATNISNDRLGSTQGLIRTYNNTPTTNLTEFDITPTLVGTAPEFLSGHPGTITFQCDYGLPQTPVNTLGPLLGGDVVEGIVSIGVKDAKRGTNARAIPNTGTFRLSIE